ncbi:hypothetical protein [Sphingomonas bacterium]|uniref:hypothetical protein n=1 Tax=Sphingomonas bacterium TaxID=1895847 RepID=UPI001575AD5C|nr:hypothetical protein [Sphingomonas bacterium]
MPGPPTLPTVDRHWRTLALLALVALAARAASFGDPVIHVDEEFYLTMASAMRHGALPFVDIWDRKPVGLFLLYLPAGALPLPWSVLTYQAMALASLIATAWLIVRLAIRAGWGRGAVLGGVAYVLWPDLLNGVGGQAPIFYDLPMAGAAWLIVAGEARPRRRAMGVAAMLLVGVSLQIKYSVVFEGVFFGLWLLEREWRTTRSIAAVVGHGGLLIVAALAPTLAALAVYAALGRTDAFVYANFLSVLHRNPDPASEMLRNIGTLLLILSPLLAMAARARGGAEGGDARVRRFLAIWLCVAIVGVALFPPWFDHYGLPILVPGTACAAGFFAQARHRRIGTAVLLLVAIGGQATVLVNRADRGDGPQLRALARAVGSGPGCLYVYSGTTMLYPVTGRCRVSRYVVPAHINRARESGATGIDQAVELRRILERQPAMIVMRPPFRGERPDIRALLLGDIRLHYGLSATLPMGRERIAVYKRIG